MFFKNNIKINDEFINTSLTLIKFFELLRTEKIKFNDLLLNIRNNKNKMSIILKLLNINIIFFL